MSDLQSPLPPEERRTVTARRALFDLLMEAHTSTDRLRAFVSRCDRKLEQRLVGGPASLEKLSESIVEVLEADGAVQHALTALAREQPGRQARVREVAGLWRVEIDWERLASDPARLEHFSQAAAHFTRDVIEWATTLPSGQHIHRPELEAIERHLGDPNVQTVALLGEAGCGKSALLAVLGQQLRAKGTHVVGIRLDRLPRRVVQAEHLQRFLGLEVPLLEVVQTLASAGPVVVLIDQLDALCDLVSDDVERLDLILRTVDGLTRFEGVHVVLACRPLEFNYDTRLRRSSSVSLTLEPPPWDEVEPYVPVRAERLSDELKDELRRPQVLHTFLTLLNEGFDPSELTTYHAMRQRSWESHVDAAPDRRRREEMLFELAGWMASHGQLEYPRSRFGEYSNELLAMESAGWLSLSGPRSSRIRFRHESFFDFTLARRITASGESPLATILQRQGLWMRRRVWSILTYLRDENTDHYQHEFNALWSAPGLRRHLRYLLIDFLSQVRGITEFEYQRMREAMQSPEFIARAWKAVGRGHAWFPWLRGSELPEQMQHASESVRAFGLLTNSATAYPEQVLELLDRHWSADAERGRLALYILECIAPANAGAAPLMRRIAALLGLRGESYSIEALLLAVYEHEPGLACSLLTDAFAADVSRAQHAAEIRAVIEGEPIFLGFKPVIEADPGLFLDAIMPTLTQALEAVAEPPSDPRAYRSDISWPYLGPEHEFTLIAQIANAVGLLAGNNVEAFRHFLLRHAPCDLSAIHHLLLLGLERAAAQSPALVVEYLCGDPRRLHIGSSIDPAAGTLGLLNAVSGVLPEECQRELGRLFLSHEARWTGPTSPKLRMLLYAEMRRHRLSLLLTLNRETLDADSQRRLDEELRASPDVPRRLRPRRLVASIIQSPMSRSEMALATDDAIVQLFAESDGIKEWSHPRYGALGAASHELVELARKDPPRGVRLARKLGDEGLVGRIFEALVESDATKETMLPLFWGGEERGFGEVSYRDLVARALERLAGRGENRGLPDDICSRLCSWLAAAKYERAAPRQTEPKRPKHHSILFRSPTIGFPHSANHSILAALFAGLLYRESPAWDEWFELLTEHLERGDDDSAWRYLAIDRLRWVLRVGHERAVAFFERLFSLYPELMDCPSGLRLIDDVQGHLEPIRTQPWIEALRRTDEWHAQAFGEMLVIRTLRLKGDDWSRREIASIVADDSARPEVRAMRRGIAFLLAKLKRAGNLDQTGHGWLFALASSEDAAISAALRDCVWSMMDRPADANGESLLRCFAKHPHHLSQEHLRNLLAMMSAYVGRAPELVFELSQKILDQTEGKGIDQEQMLRVIVTLQRQPGFVERGLDLFERACAIEMQGTDALLDEYREVLREVRQSPPRRRHRPK